MQRSIRRALRSRTRNRPSSGPAGARIPHLACFCRGSAACWHLSFEVVVAAGRPTAATNSGGALERVRLFEQLGDTVSRQRLGVQEALAEVAAKLPEPVRLGR